jgi:hypothetical protein
LEKRDEGRVADIFQEVDEELRKDRYQVWLRKYGPLVLGGAVAVVVLVGGWQFWESWSENRRDTASDTYAAAATQVEEANWDSAAVALDEIAASGPDGYATLALMQRGAVALEAGDNVAATRYFEQAAARSPDPLVRDLATLKAAMAGFETFSADDIANRLGRIAEGDNALRLLARELIATKAMDAGRYDAARNDFEAIVFALDAPQGLRARASAALAVLNRLDPVETEVEDATEAPVQTETPADTLPAENQAEDAGDVATMPEDAPAEAGEGEEQD